MPLGWTAIPASTGSSAVSVVFWLDTSMLVLGLGVIAVWVARRGMAGGFGAALGLAVPLISYAVYRLATMHLIAHSQTPDILTPARRHLLDATTALWLAAAVTAAALALAGLIRSHQFTGRKLTPLAVITSAVCVGFAFAFILRQENLNSYFPIFYSTTSPSLFGAFSPYPIGTYIHSYRILWGLAFLALAAAPPLLALLLRDPGIRVATWSGWLVFGLAWLLTFTPLYGSTAAAGLYVSWTLWIVALLSTVLMAAQVRAARRASSPTSA